MSQVLEQLVVELKADVKGLQASLDTAVRGVKGFRNQAENELSSFQAAMGRARNAVLSLTAAWGAFRLGRSIVDAGVQIQALNAKMEAATGSAQVAAEGLRFVREEAQRLGLDFRSTADGFASFTASALRSGLTFKETQDIFTGVSEAATAMRLSAERTSLVFMALSQMASKGTVSMEELRQQLGESLPGALQVFSKAMGVSNAEFIKMVENGQVTAADLVKLGQGLRKEFGESAVQAAQGAQAAFNRFGNAIFDLQTKLASSGLLDAVVKSVESLTAALSDPQLVSGLSQLITFLSQVILIATKVASAIGRVVGEVKHLIEAAGDKVFGALFGQKGVDALQNARAANSHPVRIDVTPNQTVDPNYTLGTKSAPGPSAAAQRAEQMRERLRQRVKEQASGLITEGDPNKADSAEAIAALNKRYEEEQALLEQALEKKAITEQEFRENQLKVELDYQARMAEIRRQYREQLLSDQQAFAEGFLGVQLDMQNRSMADQGRNFRNSIQQAAQHNRAFFMLEKAAAIARALISARETVVEAYRWGNSFGGPIGGAVAAGVAAAAQAVNIAAIASTSFGGDSGGGGGGGVSSAGSSDAVSSSGPTSGGIPVTKQVSVTLVGSEIATWSKNQVRELVNILNDAAKDGSKLVFSVA